jgi:hypothetical protein
MELTLISMVLCIQIAIQQMGDFDIMGINDTAMYLSLCLLEMVSKTKGLYMPRTRPTLDTFTNNVIFKSMFRFEIQHVAELVQLFGIPDFRLKTRSWVCGTEAFLIFLARLCNPAKWLLHMFIFGGSPGFLSETFYKVLHHIYDNFADPLLRNLKRYRKYFATWAAAVHGCSVAEIRRKGVGVFAFIDGTLRGMCRPYTWLLQRVCYSGHKRKHGWKHQNVTVACGWLIDMHGPEPGRR